MNWWEQDAVVGTDAGSSDPHQDPSTFHPGGGASPESWYASDPVVNQAQDAGGGSLAKDLAYSVGGGFNRGLAKGAGAMVDLVAAGMNLLSDVDIQNPVGGSQHLEGLMRKGGLVPGEGEALPIPALGRVTEEIGAAAVPFGVAGTVARTGATGGRFGAPILEAFRQSPRLNAAGELSAATGAGMGAAIAQEIAPENDTAELVGQLVGGFVHPVALAADGARAGTGTLKRVIGPYVNPRQSAANQLSKVVEDPEAAIRALSQPSQATPGAQLSPAQETGDRGLLALERALAGQRGELKERLQGGAETTQRAVRDELGDLGGGGIDEPRAFLSERVTGLREQMQARADQAQQRATQRAQALAPGASREQLSRVVREELDDALYDMRQTERELWSAIPDQVQADLTPLKTRYRELLESLPAAQREDMPAVAGRLLGAEDGALGDVDAIRQVQGLRSKLLEVARNARAGDTPNLNQARLADELQEAALDVMSGSDAGPQVAEALAWSRDLNQRFRQGPVGRVLGQERRGGDAVDSGVTLDRLVRQGATGGVNFDALTSAVDSPETRGAVADYMRTLFVHSATDGGGRVQRGAANRFMRSHSAILDRMPEVRQQLEGATTAQELAERTQNRMLARQRSLADKRKSRAALYLDAPVGREIKTVLSSRKPEVALRELTRQTSRDLTGAARKGLKTQFVDEMLAQAEKGGQISGKELGEFLDRNRKAMLGSGLFNRGDLMRIERVRATLDRIEKGIASGRKIDDLLEETPDAVTDLVARIVGANLGSHGAGASTGAPLVAAHAGSKFVRRLTSKVPFERTRDVLAEAIIDRAVMRDLLERVPTQPKADQLQRRMNAWLVNLVPEDDAETEAVTRNDGKPFASRGAASMAMRARRLEGYEPTQVDDGWVLVPSRN